MERKSNIDASATFCLLSNPSVFIEPHIIQSLVIAAETIIHVILNYFLPVFLAVSKNNLFPAKFYNFMEDTHSVFL